MNFLKSSWSYLSSSFNQSEDDANESVQEFDISQTTEEIEDAVDALEIEDQYGDPFIPADQYTDELAEFADALDIAPLQNKSDADAHPGLRASSPDSQESYVESNGILQAHSNPGNTIMAEAEVKASSGKVDSGDLLDDVEEDSSSVAMMESTAKIEENRAAEGYTSLEASDSDDSGEFIPSPANPVGAPINTESQLNEIINNLGGDLGILTLEEEESQEQNHIGEKTLFVTAYDHTICPSPPGNDTADITICSGDSFNGNPSPDSAIASSSKSSLCSIDSVKFNTEYSAQNGRPSTPLLTSDALDIGFNETASEEPFVTSSLNITVQEQLTDSREEDPGVDSAPLTLESAVSEQNSQQEKSQQVPQVDKRDNTLNDKSLSEKLENHISESKAQVTEDSVAFAVRQLDNSSPSIETKSVLQLAESQPEAPENLPLDVIAEQKTMDDPCDEIPVGRGAYTIDFDNLDDFNPFQSKKAVQNSPDLPSKPFPGIGSVEVKESRCKTQKEQNTAEESNHIAEDANDFVTLPDTNATPAKENSAIPDKLPSKSSTESHENRATEPSAISSKPEQPIDNEVESIPISHGSYSLDFDNLNNMDPFKTSKGLQNSPTMPKSSMSFSPPKSPVKNNVGLLKSMSNNETSSVLPELEKKKPLENGEGVSEKPGASDLITVDLENVDPSPRKKVAKKPVLGSNQRKVAKPKSLKKKPVPFKPPAPSADEEDEIIIPKGSYSINFDDLENMDPFQTSKGLSNSPTKKSSESPFPANTPAAIEEKPKPVEDSPGKGTSVDPPDLPLQNEHLETVNNQLMTDDPPKPTPSEGEERKEPAKKKTGAVKKKVMKPPPVEAPSVESNYGEEEIPIPKGAYNLNFDDLDSMDPFKTTKVLANSPTEKKPAGYSMDFDSVDPFKPTKAMGNSPPSSPTKLERLETKEDSASKTSVNEPAESISDTQKEEEDVKKVEEKVQPEKKVTKKTGAAKKNTKKPSPIKAPQPEPNNDEEEIPIPKGSYNINFDDLDALDPFKSTSKGIANSPVDKKPSGYSMDFDNLDAVDPFKPSKAMANSPPGSPKIQTETSGSNTMAQEPSGMGDVVIEEVKKPAMDEKAPTDEPTGSTIDVSGDSEGLQEVKEKTEKKVTKESGAVKKKRKKPSPVKAPPPETNSDEEEIPIPKGSYNVNFDDLDALDPFKSSKGLTNSPTEKKPSGYSLDLDNLDAVDPFKPSKAMANSPPGSPKRQTEMSKPAPPPDTTATSDTITQEHLEQSGASSKEVEKKTDSDKKPKKKKGVLARKKLLKPGMKTPSQPVDDNAGDEPLPLPKGAYNIDFDNLDALDPFKSGGGMSNSPTKESAPPVSSYLEKLDDLDSIDPFKPKKTVMNTPPGSPKGPRSPELQNDTPLTGSVAETSAMREAPGSMGDVDTAFQTANETADFSIAQSPHAGNAAQGVERALVTKEQTTDYKQLEQIEFDKMNEEEEFYPASSVFQDSASLAYLDKLGDEKPLTARDLKKQSLYVKFDPLVSGSPTKLIDQQISQGNKSAGGDASTVITDKKEQRDFNQTPNSETTSSAAPVNVSSSFDHHTSMDSYNQSFMNQQSYGSAPSTLKYTQADLDKALRNAEQNWEKEKSEMATRESTLKSELEQMSNVVKEYDRLFAEMSGNGSRNGMLTREQQLLKAEHEQSLEDMAALERHHEDLCRRYNRLKTVVAQFKQNEDILKKSTNEMMEEARATEKKYVSLKIKADDEIKKATDELHFVKANAQQEVARAQAQLKMLELKCESLQSQVKDCNRENDELTKLCDDLIACSKQGE